MFEVAMKLKVQIEPLYEAWGWDLYEICGYEHALDAMIVAMLYVIFHLYLTW